jgi:UDP-N-acetylmuramate dehydrogenase
VPELLADHTTLRLGGPARRWVRAETEQNLIEAVRTCDEGGEPVLVLAGGSNVVVADEGFAGTVVEVATRGITADHEGDDPTCGGVVVTVAAGESWEPFVEHAVARGWVGVEALSGIPGSVGATPVQNVGAYGQEVADTIASVRTWDRVEGRQRTFAAADCGFGYRTSRFKQDPQRYVVIDVTFQLRTGHLSTPVRYAELARRLGIETGARAPMTEVRAAVLELRRRKGMVLDAADHDTWSVGSFFTNPIVPAADVPDVPGLPRWPADHDRVKLPAAWLIENAGFGRGYPAPGGRVALSGKHVLALSNRGGGTAADVLRLAGEVRDGVRSRFGVSLAPEPVLVGCAL